MRKELVEQFAKIEQFFSREKGPFSLFALFLREEAQDKWDLVIAADWAEANRREALSKLASKLQKEFTPDELTQLSRVVIVDQDNPALIAINQTIRIEHGVIEARNVNFFGLQIKLAYIITSQKPTVGVQTPAA